MSKLSRGWIIMVLLLALGTLLWLAERRETMLAHPPSAAPAPTHVAAFSYGDRPGKLAGLTNEWRDTLAFVNAHHDQPELVRERLSALRLKWLEEDPLVLAQIVALLLQTGDDAETGLPFDVGPGGVLGCWPTLRTFLLELLACADPDRAVITAREVLNTTGSADEYALALKPLVHKGPWRAPDGELADRFAAMLNHRDWTNSGGFAEAMDLVRVCHAPTVIAALGDWLGSGGDARLAGMALHEAAAEDPLRVILSVAENPAMLDDAPVLRAELMARAMVSDPAQESVVRGYLENPLISQDEKFRFLELFPLRSATTGYRLYEANPAPFQKAAVAADDAAALKVIQSWMGDPALQSLQPSVRALESRVQTWVNQAKMNE